MQVIRVWVDTGTGPVRVAGSFTVRGALEKARQEAGGKAPRFVRLGGAIGYQGMRFAFVYEAEAKRIDATNSLSDRYPRR